MPDDEPGIAHAVPDLIRKGLQRLRPLPIFGSGEQTRTLTHVDDIADGIVVATAHAAGLNEDFNISASDELTVAEIAALCWEAAGNDPEELEFEHLESFAVDVQRRWPSVEKAPHAARLGGADRRPRRHRAHRRLAAPTGRHPGVNAPRRVEKPWGYEIWWAQTDRYAGKILHVERGHQLSLQYHEHKDESSYLLRGRIVLTKGPSQTELTETELEPGATWRNRPGEIHTIEALEDADVLEVSTPDLDDVVRLSDRYGRSS